MTLGQVAPVVVDASAIGEYVLRTDLGVQIASVIEAPETDLNTPALCDVEVCSALRRTIRSREVALDRALEALSAYLDLPLTKHGHMRLVPRIFELRDYFAASDAAYVALCEAMSATLVTCDARLTRAIQTLLPLNVIGVAL